MKKRCVSLLLALVMALGLLPSAAASMARVGQPELMAVGTHHVAVIQDGDLYVWGSNDAGGFTDKADADYKSTTPMKIMSDVVSVASCYATTTVVRSDGSLWSWGLNNFGQLGDGTVDSGAFPIRTTPVKSLDRVVAVSGNRNGAQTAAIRDDGSLWMWGEDRYGGLGLGHNTHHQASPVKVMDDVAAVTAGIAAIKTDGSLWMWGENSYGRLGIGNTTSLPSPVKVMDNVAQVESSDTTLILKADGSLWACGFGYLGNGPKTDYKTAT